MSLWRIHLKPDSKHNIDVADFCIRNKIVGIGWGIPQRPNTKEEYWRDGEKEYDGASNWKKAVNAMLFRMTPCEDLIWTRNKSGIYFLGQILSNWYYEDSQKHKDADIYNLRKCSWFRVGTMVCVPGKVVNSFRASATVQRVHDDTAEEYSQFLFNRLSKTDLFEVGTSKDRDVFSLLSPDDLEDVVGLYLQVCKDYVLYPSTCKTDTQTYEYVLVSKIDSKLAFVQVKTGHSEIEIKNYESLAEWGIVYLFSTSGSYTGKSSHQNIVCLPKKEVEQFLFNQRSMMPERIQKWLKYLE